MFKKLYSGRKHVLTLVFRALVLSLTLVVLSAGGLAVDVFTEPGGNVSFTTQDYQVYTTGTDGVGDKSLNFTGNTTGLSSVDDPVEAWFKYREAGTSDSWQQVDAGTVEDSEAFSRVVTGLDPGTEYEFEAFTKDYGGGIDSDTTSTYSVSTEGVDIGVDWLRFRGDIQNVAGFTDTIDDMIQLQFQYREAGAPSWTTANADLKDSDGIFEERVEGLSPNTEYEFRAKSEDGYQGSILTKYTTQLFTQSGGQQSFTTQDYSVLTTGTDGVGDRSLNFTGEASSLSNLEDPINAWFNYRETGGSWQQVDAGTIDSSETFNRVVTGLNPDTDYEFEACTKDYCGSVNSDTTSRYNISTTGADIGVDWFRFNGEITDVSQFTGDINDQIQLQFQYKETGASTWNTVNADKRSVDGFYKERVEGLNPDTEYEFRAKSEDGEVGSKITKSTTQLFTESGGVVSFATGPYFAVTVQDVNEPVIEGNDVEVEALIENTGADGSTTLDLSIPGLGSNSTSLTLDGGSATTETLSISTSEGDSGEYTANFSSGSDYATQVLNVSTLNPPVNPLPKNDSEPVGLDWDLSAESNSSGIETGLEFYIVNESGSDLALGGNLSSPNERINVSLESQNLDPGTEYEWYSNSTYNGQSAQSQVWNFTTVERPQVSLAEPHDESVDPNPVLNVTVDGNSPINVTVGESTGIDFKTSNNVNPGDTVQVDTSGISDFGNGSVERWNVSLEAYGAERDNSDNFYNFTVADINGVDYNLQDISSGDNLNPGNFGDLKVYGENAIAFQVDSDPDGEKDMGFEFNVSNGTETRQFTRGNVDDGEVISLNLSKIGIVNENSKGYSAEAYYLSGTEPLDSSEFVSNTIDFSTHVAEVEFTHPGDNVDEFRVLYNATSNSSYSQVASVPIEDLSSDQNDLYQIGVANPGLKDNSQSDCYQVEAWNRFGGEKAGYQDGGDQCLGGSNP
ncbi:MAG: hypothetical protein R6V35_02935 [Candidatus Nanohaloarchaea archaeon]